MKTIKKKNNNNKRPEISEGKKNTDRNIILKGSSGADMRGGSCRSKGIPIHGIKAAAPK